MHDMCAACGAGALIGGETNEAGGLKKCFFLTSPPHLFPPQLGGGRVYSVFREVISSIEPCERRCLSNLTIWPNNDESGSLSASSGGNQLDFQVPVLLC